MNMSKRFQLKIFTRQYRFLKDFAGTVCSDLVIFDMSARRVENPTKKRSDAKRIGQSHFYEP